MIVSKVMEAFTQQVRSRLIISNKKKDEEEEEEEEGNVCLRLPFCNVPFVKSGK